MQQLALLICVGLQAGLLALSVQGQPIHEGDLATILKQADEIMKRGTLEGYKEAQELLVERCKSEENSALFWRLAQCCYHICDFNKDADKADRMVLAETGLEFARKALTLNDKDADAHKWYALLSGEKGSLNSIFTGKVSGGLAYKKHLHTAMELRPHDPSLHHHFGIYQYEVGKMTPVEKLCAIFVLGDISDATVKSATKSFLMAAMFSNEPWKMNCVYLAKCYLHKGNLSETNKWLDVADKIPVKNREDEEAAKRITEMRKSAKLQ